MAELSGGERQRAVLARALATKARLFLLDEPTANLDIKQQERMFRLVRERCRSRAASAIVITHDLNLGAAFADEIVMLRDGRIAAAGKPDETITTANVRDVFGVNSVVDQHPVTGGVRITSVFGE